MGTPLNLTKGDLDLAASITINLGFLARNFYDTRTIDVISAFAGFYNHTPNATDPEILAFSGARPQDLDILLQFMTLVYSASALYHAVNINISSQFWSYSWNEIARQQMFYIVLDILYPIAALIIKSSLLLFYYSLFSGRYLRLSVWATFGFTLATTMTIILYSIFKCHPVAYWSEWYTSECDSHQKIPYLVTGSFMILSDVIIWVLPLPMVLKLQLYRRERIAAIFTFSLGIFACIASIFRLQAVYKYFFTSAGTGKTPIINTWTIVELNLAIICASAPALRALCIRHAPKLLSYGSNSTDSNSSNSSSNNSGNGSMNERTRKNTRSVHGRVIVHHDQIRPSDLASLRSGISRTGSGWSDVEKSVHYSSTSRIGSPV
ncbi:hypothetical protein TWF679_000141 [Orbilia oligospora]|uniref:Rhodopsin domain-containing protein n=1 Tax=Orbilia oligospora TaxID=2813651 RepID=A0A8H8VN66_ORBOL|nr:hypothetical protein TWF679_000141 [Orbilia oligospora]